MQTVKIKFDTTARSYSVEIRPAIRQKSTKKGISDIFTGKQTNTKSKRKPEASIYLPFLKNKILLESAIYMCMIFLFPLRTVQGQEAKVKSLSCGTFDEDRSLRRPVSYITESYLISESVR
jgi:hypothetical protein